MLWIIGYSVLIAFIVVFVVGLLLFFSFLGLFHFGYSTKTFLGVKTRTQASQFPAEHPRDQLFTLLSHTWWTFQYLIKEEQHGQERVLPRRGHAVVLCVMQLCPGRGESLHLVSSFLTSACNCQAPFSQKLGTTQGASPRTSVCYVCLSGCVSQVCEHLFFEFLT